MSTGVIYLRPIEVIRVRGFGQNRDAAQSAWEKMFSWAETKGYRAHAVRAFGLVYKTDDRKDRASYDACVELNDDMVVGHTEGLETALVPSGAYLRKRFDGQLDEMGAALRKMRVEEIPSRGLTLDGQRPMIEIYLNDFLRRAIKPKIDLCVPVRT